MEDRFESLPLFPDELPPASRSRAGQSRAGDRTAGTSRRGAGATSAARGGGDPHLVAARRLARAIGRLPDHSPEQTRAGQAICRHLLALLEEAEQR